MSSSEASAARLAAAVAARPQELHGVGHDLDGRALASVLRRPLSPLEPAVDGDGAALREVLGAVLALGAPDLDVEVVGLLDPLAARLVLVAAVHCQPEPAHRRAAGQRRELGIGGQVACQDDSIDVCHGFLLCLLYERTFGYRMGVTGRWVRPTPRPARAPRPPWAAAWRRP